MPRRSQLRITKRTVDALRVQEKDAVFWDRDLAGFGVRVHATGRKVYVVQSRGPRGLKRVSLGRHGELSPDEARRSAAAAIDRIKRGETPLAAAATPVTVADLAERFMRFHVAAHCKPRTAVFYQSVLNNQILPSLGAMAVEAVGRKEVADLHQRLCDTPYRANHAVRVLSRMFSLAEAWELIPAGANPCRSVRQYKVTARERFLTRDEFKRLGRVLQQAEADGSVWPGAIAAIRLLVLTGCRHSEILALRWDDVDVTAGELRLRDSKTGPRMVPLTWPVAAVLDNIPRVPGSHRVIAGRRVGGALSHIHGYWNRIRERADLADVRLHDLRHSYASRALELGESLPTIGKLLGHAAVSTTARYAHLVRDAERAAAARVGSSIGTHLETQDAQAA